MVPRTTTGQLRQSITVRHEETTVPGITHRSTRQPLLKTRFLSHGTLECRDIAATRRFYEEVLGLEVVQQAPLALFVRLAAATATRWWRPTGAMPSRCR